MLFVDAVSGWLYNNANRMAAALSFYVMLSLSPLLVIAVGLATLFVDYDTAVNEIIQRLDLVAGPIIQREAAKFITNTVSPDQRFVAGSASILIVLYGASNVFNQLQEAFNTIWNVTVKGKRANLWLSLKRRLSAFVWVFCAGIIVTALVMSSTAVASLNSVFAREILQVYDSGLFVVDLIISLVLLTILFSVMFKFLPQTAVYWTDVHWGGFLTAVLFVAGKYGLSYYLSRRSVTSAYGAAGSLVVILIWAYYSGLIVFFGAEFTRAYAQRFGSLRPPEEEDEKEAEG